MPRSGSTTDGEGICEGVEYATSLFALHEKAFVEKYGVEGIPTKFVIDMKGMIQFKSVGFLGGDKMVEELTMLFDEKFYSSLN